jgi:serine beta-lactamase-like protein LACTB, mitochondrial
MIEMINRTLPNAVLLVLLMSPVRLAAQTQPGLPPDKIKKVEEAVTSEMNSQNIPAVSVAVVINNQLQWSNGYGLADKENYVPAKAITAYRLASISKTITAVSAMQLAEQGKLDLDAPVQKYCPAFPTKQWPITARELLSHMSGIRHYKDREEVQSTRHFGGFDPVVESLDMFKDDPLKFEPGTDYGYSTFGFVLLGCVIEGASGMKYADYIRERISKPAGMANLRVDEVSAIIPNRAQGYVMTKGGEIQNSALADNSDKIPAGGLSSTVEDLAQFAIAVNTGKLLKPETVRQMWETQRKRDGTSTGYGLGWSLGRRGGQLEVWHDGAQPQVSTILYMLPDKGFALAVMTNLEGVSMLNFARRIADAAQ